jgi:hypothetical protein
MERECIKRGAGPHEKESLKQSRHVLYTLLGAVGALWKRVTKQFCRPVFIKSVHFNETIINARFYFVPSDEKYYLSYMERRNYFDFMFGLLVRKRAIEVDTFNVIRHHYALGVFELDNLD